MAVLFGRLRLRGQTFLGKKNKLSAPFLQSNSQIQFSEGLFGVVPFKPQQSSWIIPSVSFSCLSGNDKHNSLNLKAKLRRGAVQQVRWQVRKSDDGGRQKQQLVEATEKTFRQLTPAEKVKQTTKDVTYTGIIIVGVGVTAVMFYMIGRELFSKQSPSGVFGEALKLCKKHGPIVDCLGEPIRGYGETTRRGRRRHVSHMEWQDNDGLKHMRMKFYVEGPDKKGTVHLEVKQNERGKYEYRYLFVELDGYPRRTIFVQDNR